MNDMTKTAIQARSLTKTYHRGSEDVRAVNGISLEIEKGQFVAFIGPSGSGKTTLINILGCLDNPSSGSCRSKEKRFLRKARRCPKPG